MTILNGNFRQYELDNGLVVALQNTPTQTIAGKLRVNFGAFHEVEGERGLAHFLEHCIFTGGSEKYTADQQEAFFSNLGYLNASTNIGRTSYDTHILSEDLEQCLDYLSDSVFNPEFDNEKFEGERGRVLREIADIKSFENFEQIEEAQKAFYRGHPKSIFVAGDEKVI